MTNKHIHQAMLRHMHETDDAIATAAPSQADAHPRHWRQFLKTAANRKRQILEKMLLDSEPDAG